MFRTRTVAGGPAVALDDSLGLQSVTACLALGRSARDDAPDSTGAAHLLEHLVMAAPQQLDGLSLSEWVDTVGGQTNASTSQDFLAFWLRVPPEWAASAVPRLIDAVVRPAFEDTLCVSERRVVVQELRSADADPLDRADREFHAQLFPDHALGAPVGGDVETLPEFGASSLSTQLADAVASAPLALAVVGPTQLLDEIWSELPNGPLDASRQTPPTRPVPARRPPPPIGSQAGSPVSAPPQTDYCYLVAGGRGADRREELWPAFQILTAAVGGTPGSLLYSTLRNRDGLTYELHSVSTAYCDCGTWRVIAGCEPGDVARVDAAILDCLRTVAAGELSIEKFAAARAQSLGSVQLDNEDPVALAHLDAYWLAEGLVEAPPVAATIQRIGAVGPDQLGAAAQRVLDSYVRSVAG